MSRFFLPLTAGLALVVLTACGQGGFKAENAGKAMADGLGYKLACGAEKTYATMADLCDGLQAEAANAGCEEESRKIFAERCPGEFKPGTPGDDPALLSFANPEIVEKPKTGAKPAAEAKPSPAPAPAPQAAAPAQPGAPTASPDITVPTPPAEAPKAPAAPAPKPAAPAREPDFSKVIIDFPLQDGESTRWLVLRKDLDTATFEIACAKSLTASLERVEYIHIVAGSQVFAPRKTTAESKQPGKVAACKGTVAAGATDTPSGEARIERVAMDHGAAAQVRTMDGQKLEIRCMKDKATALTSMKTGLGLLAGAVMIVKTGDGESVPLRIYHCAN